MTQQSSLLEQRLEWIPLGRILKNDRLKVPEFQRSYAWERGDYTDFWDDLKTSIKEDAAEYFLGPIVVAAGDSGDGRLLVIDGQQRLATVSILLSVLRDELVSLGDTSTAEGVQRDFLGAQDRRTRITTPRFILNDQDRTYFSLRISELADDPPEAERESHRKIAAAREFFIAELAKELSSITETGGHREYLLDWVDLIEHRAIVMLAVVPEESDAYTIFETLNARGVPLAIADLLKNHLFSTSRDSLDEVRLYWQQAVDRIAETDENAITDFLRHYWISHHGLVREQHLYRDFKEDINTITDAQTFASDLEQSARDYASLLNPSHQRWRDLDHSTGEAFETLFSFRIQQNRPLLLAAVQEFEPTELSRLITRLVAWSTRGLVVGGIGKGRNETSYANAAVAVRTGEATTAEQVFEYLQGIIPTDPEFQAAFASYSPPTNRRTHYLLRALEKGLGTEVEPYVVPNPDRTELTVEHVLPRNPRAADWRQIPQSRWLDYQKRLGNLALVTRTPNIAIGNRPFEEKRETFASAGMELTREIASYDRWNIDSIENRQSKLAEMALNVWPREP